MKRSIFTLAISALSAASFADVWDSGTINVPFVFAEGRSITFTLPISGKITGIDVYMNPIHTWRAWATMALGRVGSSNNFDIYHGGGFDGDFRSAFFRDGGRSVQVAGETLDSASTGFFYQAGPTQTYFQDYTEIVTPGSQWTFGTYNQTSEGAGAAVSRIVIYTTPVPEPASMAVLSLGAVALIRRRKAAKK